MFDWCIFLNENMISGKPSECKIQTDIVFSRSHASVHPRIPPPIYLMLCLSHCVPMTSFITPHLGLLADMAQERQLQMEDVEDASQIIDDWEDMEIEDNMDNMVDIYLFFAYRNVQNSHYSTG